jgi:UDP-GlcNAc:undecaprenyl-phosphate GlcNAc-1-phosphate transferase
MSILELLLSPLAVCFTLTFICILVLKPVAYKMGLVDWPGGRKEHARPTPLIGGIALLLGFLGALLLLPVSLMPFRGLIFGAALLVFVGVLDDYHELSPRGRLLAQLTALTVMIFWSHVQLTDLGNLFGQGEIHLTWFALPLTLFGAASLINAINMLDGLDGQSGSIVLIALCSLMGLAFASGVPDQGMVLGLVVAAVLAYLCFNFPLPWRAHASCFMGDAGSMFLGFILAWFTISLSQQPHTLARPALMLWIAAVPLLDLATVFIKRIRTGRSPLHAGRDHLHHRLQDRGFSKRGTLGVVITATLATNLIAWVMIFCQVPDFWVLLGFLALFGVYFMLDWVR